MKVGDADSRWEFKRIEFSGNKNLQASAGSQAEFSDGMFHLPSNSAMIGRGKLAAFRTNRLSCRSIHFCPWPGHANQRRSQS